MLYSMLYFGVIILNYTKVVRKEARKDKPKTVREKWKRYEDKGFPDGPVVKNPPASAGHMGVISGSGGFCMPWSK